MASSTVCSRWWVIGQTGVWPLVRSPSLIKCARETCDRTCGSHGRWEEHSGTVIRARRCLLLQLQVSLLPTAPLQSSLGSCIFFISAEQTISGRFRPYPRAQSHYGMGNVSCIFTARKASTKSSPFPHPLFQLCLKFPSEGIFLNVWLDLEEPCLHRTLINCRHQINCGEEDPKHLSRHHHQKRLSVVPGPAGLAPPGNLVEIRNHGPHLRPTESEPTLGPEDLREHDTLHWPWRKKSSAVWNKDGQTKMTEEMVGNKLAIVSRTLLEQYSTPWFLKQVEHLTIHKYTFPDHISEIQVLLIWGGA